MESFFFWPAEYLHNAKVLHLVKERSIVCPSLSTLRLHKSRSKTGRLSKIGALNAKRKNPHLSQQICTVGTAVVCGASLEI